ncbi:MAG: protein-disulfide reductase DsbD domain-containing protein, partial [Chthonomonadales bacterium]
GGWHRYSTDALWRVPHFEKMIYDNAMLARAYADAGALTGTSEYRQNAVETLDWAIREMRGPEGGFYSSLDADSAGEEGKFYVWTLKELNDVLGPVDAKIFAMVYNVKAEGNFRAQPNVPMNGQNIFYKSFNGREYVKTKWGSIPNIGAKLAAMRTKLHAARAKRVRPTLDDKRLTAWNALMIGSLAHCSVVLREPKYLKAAIGTAEFVMKSLRKDGKLLRRWRPGSENSVPIDGYLEDYAYLTSAFLDLHAADPSGKWLTEAKATADQMIKLFAAPGGGFFDGPEGAELILFRARTPFDQALPSPNGVAAQALIRLGNLTGNKSYKDAGIGVLKAFGLAITRAPRATETMVEACAMVRAPGASAATVKSVVRGPVSASATLKTVNGKRTIEVKITVEPGYHIQSNAPKDPDLIATAVRATGPKGAVFGVPVFPKAKAMALGFSKDLVSIFEGVVVIPIEVKAGAGKFKVELQWQACDDKTCLAPVTVVLDVE